jgi:acyl-CoA thioester hydrolase
MDNKRLPFSGTMRVRFSDADAQGHLYFANYMVFADEVAGHYMEELGYGAMNPQDAPALIFTVNINCDYKSECKSGDSVLVQVGYEKLGNSSAVLAYELRMQETEELLASGRITQVFVDPGSRTSCPIPAEFRAAIIARQPSLA